MQTLRERLAIALAKKRGGSQAALARACKVSTASVADWFSGKTRKLRGSSLLAAAEYLNVRPRWLESGLGPMELDAPSPAYVARETDPTKYGWPFDRITEVDVMRLTSEQRAQVEGFILGLLASSRPVDPRATGTGTNGRPY